MLTVSTSERGERYHHGDLKRALVEAGLSALAEEGGPDKLSLRGLARRVAVSAMAPYRHFEDREALLAALAGEGYRMLGEAMRQAAEAAPADRMRAIGEAYIRFALAHPPLFRLMFGGAIPFGRRHPELNLAADAAFGVLRGEMEGRPSRYASPLAAWSTVHGLAMLLIEGRLGIDLANASGVEAAIGSVLG